jgi:hypothetical protein
VQLRDLPGARHAGALAELWRMVAPGGRLGVTSWGPELFEPAGSIWANALDASGRPTRSRPGRRRARSGRARRQARALFAAGGIDGSIESEYVAGTHPIRHGDDWWTIVLAPGMRGVIEMLDPAAAERVRVATITAIDAAGIDELVTDVHLHRRHQTGVTPIWFGRNASPDNRSVQTR